MRTYAAFFAVPLSLAGCASLIGADFNRDGADASLSPDAATDAGASGTSDAKATGIGADAGADGGAPVTDASPDLTLGTTDAPQDAPPLPAAPNCGDMRGLDPQSAWPMGGRCPTRVGRSNGPSLRHPTIAWRYSVDVSVSSAFIGLPVLGGDGTVYAPAAILGSGAYQYVLVAVLEGVERFRVPLAGMTNAAPAVAADGTLYVRTIKDLSAWAKDGTPRWSHPLEPIDTGSPAILPDGTIVVAGTSLYAFHPDGTPRWTYPSVAGGYTGSVAITPSGLLVVNEAPSPNTLSGAVVLVTPEGTLRRRIALPSAASPRTSPVILDDGSIIIHTATGGFQVFSELGVNTLTQGNVGIGPPHEFPAVASPTVWFGSDRHVAVRLDLSTGAVEAQMALHVTSAFAAAADGSLVVGTRDQGNLTAVGLTQAGNTLWSVPLEPSSADTAGVAIGADGTVYLPWGTTLYALRD